MFMWFFILKIVINEWVSVICEGDMWERWFRWVCGWGFWGWENEEWVGGIGGGELGWCFMLFWC